MKEKNKKDNNIISLGSVKGIHIVHDYLPYTIHRIRRILEQEFDCRLENIWQGYKANRREGYREIYKVIQNSDNKIIVEGITLDGLRRFLAKNDFPLYDEKSSCNISPRNPKADAFLTIVYSLKHQD